MYHVLEDTLSDHTEDYYSTIQLNAAYDPHAECPRFLQFLREAMDGDEEQICLIQEILGYLLVPITKAQKFFVLLGAAGAGKSVLLRVINGVLLSENCVSNVPIQKLDDRFKTAELFGKLVNLYGDLPSKPIEDNSLIKALTGEDRVIAERKFEHPFNFQSTARHIFSCNSLPLNMGDRSEGLYRRMIIVPFYTPVPEERKDPDLISKLQEEADGILQFALAGLRRLIDQNFHFSIAKKNLDALQAYREDSDSVLAFVRDCCVLDPGAVTGSSELYQFYTEYCQQTKMLPQSQRRFVRSLVDAYGLVRNKDSLGKRRVLRGIRFDEMNI